MKILEKIAKISSFDEGQYKKWEEIQEKRNIKKNHRNIDEYRLINKTVKKSLDFTFYCQFSNEISVKKSSNFLAKSAKTLCNVSSILVLNRNYGSSNQQYSPKVGAT